MEKNKGKKVAGIVALIFGIMFVVMALIFAVVFVIIGKASGAKSKDVDSQVEQMVSEGAVLCTGEIVSTENSGTTVEYYDSYTDYYYQLTMSAETSKYPVGSYVDVYYDQYDPTDSIAPDVLTETYNTIDTVFTVLGICLGLGFGVIGAILIIIGSVCIKKSKAY